MPSWRDVLVVRIIGKVIVRACLLVSLTSSLAFANEKEGADVAHRGKVFISPSKAIQHCRFIKQDKKRLSCFDAMALRFGPPTYKGRLGTITDNFTIHQPHLLRYRSQGVIFVLYLRGDKGQVLQNFHIGGSGEDEYLIKNKGTYSLKIHGSSSWQIWLDPVRNE